MRSGHPAKSKITYNCWNVVADSYDFTLGLDSSSFVSFYGMFRKAHLLPTSPGKFDSSKHLTKAELRFFPWVTLIVIRWRKTTQFRERVVEIPLPCVPRSKLCPTAAILHAFSFTPPASDSQAASIGLKPPPQNRGFLLIINFSANLGIILLS